MFLGVAAQNAPADVRREAASIIGSGLPDAALDAELRALADGFRTIISDDFQTAGVRANGIVSERIESTPAGS